MPMDDRTKSVVRALLGRHPRGYAAEAVGLTVTGTASGLFRLLCLAVLARDTELSGGTVPAAQAVFGRDWGAPAEMLKPDEGERAAVLAGAGCPDPQRAARQLGEAARLVLDRYQGDLRKLRDEAGGDSARLRRLLSGIPGMDGPGLAVFLREAQSFWPEAGPFVDERAARAARRLGLPADAGELAADVARGGGEEQLSWLTGALALTDARDEYDRILADAGA